MARRSLVAALLALATISILAAPASASTSYRYDNNLRWWVHNALEAASETDTHGKTVPLPVEVRCYSDRFAFELGALRRGDSPNVVRGIIAYWGGGNTIHMRKGTCDAATEFTHGLYTATAVGAMTSLLHEALHRQGFRSEGLTEAFAIGSMRAAGRLAQYNIYLNNGGSDDGSWDAAAPTGDKVFRIAFEQSNRIVAANYRTTWKEVTAAASLGWAGWLKL